MDKFLFMVIGYFVNAGILYLISKFIRNFNLLTWLCTYLPTWLGGTLSFILLVVGCSIAGCAIFTFGALVYEAIEIHDMELLVRYIFLDIMCMLYLYIVTNKLKR